MVCANKVVQLIMVSASMSNFLFNVYFFELKNAKPGYGIWVNFTFNIEELGSMI
jgi:hypothetical protein